TAELARTTLSRFNQIASELHELTGDPELRNDLRQTVSNLRGATYKGQAALQQVEDLLCVIGNKKVNTQHQQTIELASNISEQLSPTRLRLDVGARIHFGKTDVADVGFYDLGQNTRLILQAGTQASDSLLFRYGLYASKIGAGVDYQATPQIGLRAD